MTRYIILLAALLSPSAALSVPDHAEARRCQAACQPDFRICHRACVQAGLDDLGAGEGRAALSACSHVCAMTTKACVEACLPPEGPEPVID